MNIDLQIATGAVNFTTIQLHSSKAFFLLKKARQLWGSVDYNWQRWVINYSGDNQSKFLSFLGISNIKSMLYWLLSSISLISFVLAWIVLKNKPAKTNEELKQYLRFCKKLTKAGFYKQNGETAQKFSIRIQKERPDLADRVNKITRLFIKIRYQQNKSKDNILTLKILVNNLQLKEYKH